MVRSPAVRNGPLLVHERVYPAEEIADIVESHQVVKVVELAIPETEGARHLILFKRKSTSRQAEESKQTTKSM